MKQLIFEYKVLVRSLLTLLHSYAMRLTFKSITNSKQFATFVKKSFEQVDYDNNGKLDHEELQIALLLLYDKLNNLLPVHMTVPTREEVSSFLTRYDYDKSGQLEYPEFLDLAKALFGGEKGWKDSILLRSGSTMLMNLLIWPLAGIAMKRGVMRLGLKKAASIPATVWTILVENLTNMTKAMLFK